MDWYEVNDKLNSIKHEHKEELRDKACDFMLDDIIRGFYFWQEDFRNFLRGSVGELFIKQAKKLTTKSLFFDSVCAFFEGDFMACIKNIDEFLLEKDNISVYLIDFCIFPVFKNAFAGFWEHIRELASANNHDEGVLEFIDAIEAFYDDNSTDDTVIDLCGKALQIDNQIVSLKEMLVSMYKGQKRWNNALAYYEQVEEPYTAHLGDWYFDIAWAYSKIKEHKKSIEYYDRCLDITPEYTFAKNNLCYEYIRLKDYNKAIIGLKEVIDGNFDIEERKYASNNLVTAYLGVGKLKEAENFALNSKIKLWKASIDRIKAFKNKGAVIIDNIKDNDDDDVFSAKPKSQNNQIKKCQFTSEKILEDELELRIQSGQPVFGKLMKIYRRKGEYGRQYIISIGRIDLLAEDEEGNLYIIELKKDSGYDDAYKQTVNYVNWFEKRYKNKKIYGIICLNNPSDKLVKNAKSDARIKLYEYSISYSEIK